MISYNKLMQLLKQRNISKTKLASDIDISSDTLAKLAKNQPISMEVLSRICLYLGVTPNEVIEIIEEYQVSPLLKQLLEEKSNAISGGIYHETQVIMTYNTNHIEGSKLTEEQTRYIFETATLLSDKNSGVLVDDVIETVNHFECIRYVLDHVFEPLSETLIKDLHRILKTGTKDASLSWFKVGDYKLRENVVGGLETAKPSEVQSRIQSLLGKYNTKRNKTFEDIVEFHYEFEIIHPFQDGNGRVGRLIAFKECLKYGHVPFIISEPIKVFYYRGLKEYSQHKGYLTETCLSGQDKYKKLMDMFSIGYEA